MTEKDSGGNVTKVVEYTYDVFNRRIGKAVDTTSPFDMQDAAVERYVLDDIHNGMASADGGNVVLVFADADGPGGSGQMALAKRYLWGENVDQLLAQEDVTKVLSATDRVLWPIVDHMQTVRGIGEAMVISPPPLQTRQRSSRPSIQSDRLNSSSTERARDRYVMPPKPAHRPCTTAPPPSPSLSHRTQLRGGSEIACPSPPQAGKLTR